MGNKPITYDHLRGKKRPLVTKVRVPLDSQVQDRYEESANAMELAKLMATARPEDTAAQADLDQKVEAYRQAKEAMVENSVEFVFRALGRKPFEKLKLAHPRTAKQKAEDEKEGRAPGTISWNHDTFPPALVAASAISPALTEADVQDMWDNDDWSEAELALLFQKAIEANESQRVVDLGKG